MADWYGSKLCSWCVRARVELKDLFDVPVCDDCAGKAAELDTQALLFAGVMPPMSERLFFTPLPDAAASRLVSPDHTAKLVK